MLRKQTNRSYAKTLLVTLLSVTTILLLTHLGLQSLNWYVYFQQNGFLYELANRFDLDDEASVPTWFSQILFFLISVLALLAGYLEPASGRRRLWQIIGSLGLLFSIDEISGLHEFLLQSLHVVFFEDASPTSFNNAWLLVAPFILAIALTFIWQVWRLLPRRTLALFMVAGATFLAGAIAVDLFTSVVDRETFLNQGLLSGLEETLELLGSVIVVYAIADFLETHHRVTLGKAKRQLGS